MVNDHFPRCEVERRLGWSPKEYSAFKRSFNFEMFAYCYHCGMPQDRRNNGEGPQCHAEFDYGNGTCDWAHFIFKVTFRVWQDTALRKKMAAEMGVREPIDTLEEFKEWANGEDAGSGKYYNGLEVFLWFCRRKETEDPAYFL